MKREIVEVVRNEKVGENIFLMELKGDFSAIKNPGEFVELELPNHYLRRAFSVCRVHQNRLEILVKILGQGTKEMAEYPIETRLDCLVGLGNGFDINKAQKPLLLAGGIGIAPMLDLAERFLAKGIRPIIVYGAAKKEDLVLISELCRLGEVQFCTEDGSYGFKGNPIDYLKSHPLDFDYYYACGPQVFLKNLKEFNAKGCLSLEARMGCGFGACMGCSIKTTTGPKRVCKEGPVFEASEVLFE